MTDQQFQLAWNIYQQASDLSAEERTAFFKTLTADPSVVAGVLELLEESDRNAAGSLASAARPNRIGSLIGPFVITGFLGRGGMGEVYSARDTTLGRAVALKMLRSGHGADDLQIKRHISEAKAASSLNHPNIVSVFQVVESGSDVAIAMELVEGNSFRRIAGKPVPLEHVCHFGIQVAAALTAAHRQGIVHRDIKPENLMVRPDSFVKVLDFGLAKEITADSLSGDPAAPLGTLRYMSPEQIRGESVTGATDIFSLGLVLYELATGRHPFPAQSPIDAAHAITAAAPAAPSSLNKFLPASFDALTLSMLAKEPSRRPTAHEVEEALCAVGSSAGSTQPELQVQPAPPKHGGKPLRWIVALAAVALLAIAIVRLQPFGTASFPGQSETKAVPEIVLAAGPDSPAPRRYLYGIKPDGALLVYVDDSRDAGGFSSWIAQAVSAPPLPGVNLAAFERLLAGGDGVLYGISGEGAVTYFRLLDPWRNQGPMRWSSDSNTVIGNLSGEFTQLAALSRPAWVPDGTGKERVPTAPSRAVV